MTDLVTFYSHGGNTAALAHQIALRLGAEEEPIVERHPRTGIWGIATGAVGAVLKQAGPIADQPSDPAAYDLVLIGTPVWAAAPAPAVNAWIDAHRGQCKQLAFFATTGKTGESRAFAQMKNRAGQAPAACVCVMEDELGQAAMDDKLDRFIAQINAARQ